MGYADGEAGAQAASKLQATLGSKPWSHWAPLFEAANCCVEPVLGYEELY